MNKKDIIGDLFNQLRLQRQRSLARQPVKDNGEDAELEATLGQMLMVMDHLDTLIGTPHPKHVIHTFIGCLEALSGVHAGGTSVEDFPCCFGCCHSICLTLQDGFHHAR